MTPHTLDEQERGRICTATAACLQKAGEIYAFDPHPVPVRFDLTGRAAGMYQVQRGQRRIRYNPYIFARYFDDNLAVTVPHEVAHYVTDRLFGLCNTRPHGPEWKGIMKALGADARITADYNLEGIPIRRQQRHAYRCECSTHLLSTCRHNRVRRGAASYLCRKCGSPVVRVEAGEIAG